VGLINPRRGPDRLVNVGLSCDVLVLGTGAAGLALIARLAASPQAKRRVVLVDHRVDPAAGRVWAYWSARHTWLHEVVSHSWDRLAVIADGLHLELYPSPYSYQLLRGEHVQAYVDRLLERSTEFTRLTGAVHELDDGPDVVTVRVGEVEVRAGWVLDSRPPPPPSPDQVRLRFLGQEIRAEGAGFDPGCATFMDFRARTPGEVRFCYVLPTSVDQALVEIAAFASGQTVRHDLAEALTAYLREVCGLSTWQVLRQELGDLPLHVPGPRRIGRHVLRVGAAGGMLKPSTGYAFDRIVRDADAVVRSLDRYGHPWAVPRPRRRHAWLDEVLLGVISADPGAVEPAFARMFARNPVQRVLRFLDEDTGLCDELRLVATLPPTPFLRAAVRRHREGLAHRSSRAQ
jgi:lycopene beta-cyclase